MSLRALIIGAGFGGVAAAVQLQRAGFQVSLLERSEGVGGTWRANIYPGAACDIPCHLYSLSFAPRHNWSRRYASQPEILAYLEGVVADFGPKPRFGVEIAEAAFDSTRGLWTARSTEGELFEAEVLAPVPSRLFPALRRRWSGSMSFREVLPGFFPKTTMRFRSGFRAPLRWYPASGPFSAGGSGSFWSWAGWDFGDRAG